MQDLSKLLLLSLFLISCNTSKRKPSEVRSVSLKLISLKQRYAQTFDIGDIYKGELTLLKLKQAENFVIGQVDKAVFFNNRFYILDKSVARRLFIYDIKGNPIRSYDGKEDEQNYSVSDFSIDQDKLYILDESKKSILVYDLLATTLSKSIFIAPDNICNIEVLNGDIICYRILVDNVEDIFGNATVFRMDLKGSIKDFWLPIDRQNFYLTRYSSDFPILQKDQEYIYISRFMDQSLFKYSTTTKELINDYVLDFGGEGISTELKKTNDDQDFVNKLETGKYSYSMSGYIATSSFSKLHICKNGSIKSLFLLKNGNGFEVTNIKYKNTLLPILSIAQVTDQLFLFYIPQHILSSLKQELVSGKTSDPLVKLLKYYHTESGNPVIVKINK